jgi:hypothetical protein
MAEAGLIVLVAGSGSSLAWELAAIVRDGLVSKTVFMFSKPAWWNGLWRRKSESAEDRIRALLIAFTDTPWHSTLSRMDSSLRAQDIRAIALLAEKVVIITSRSRSWDSFFTGSIVAHYAVRKW